MTVPSSVPPSLQAGLIATCDADGELVARKVVTAADTARLQHEVEVLAHLRDLDVVALAAGGGVRSDGHHAWVDLVHVDATSLGDALEGPPARLLAALASVARTMMAAHARGVSHGRLDRTHILLVGSRTIVCGWSDAGLDLPDTERTVDVDACLEGREDGRVAEGPAERGGGNGPDVQPWHDVATLESAFDADAAGGTNNRRRNVAADPGVAVPTDMSTGVTDPGVDMASAHSGSGLHRPVAPPRSGGGGWTAAPFDPISDVAALGELCAAAAQHRALTGRMRTQLTAVATIARHPDPGVRPPMSELARVLSRQDPGDPTSGELDATDTTSRTRALSGARWLTRDTFSRRPLPKVLLGGAAAVVAAGLTTMLLADPPTRHDARASAADATAETGETSAASVRASDEGIRTPEEAADPPSGVDAGPGTAVKACPTTAEELTLVGLPKGCVGSLGVTVNANVVTVGALQYEVGNAGDVVFLSDPTCEDKLVAVLLQPADGRVYIYDRWASADHPSSARPLGRVPGATSFSEPIQLTCGPVSVVGPDGALTAVGGEAR